MLHIDVSHHASERELRSTVLHEMIHAVVGRGGHHAPFWTHLEHSLSQGAPIAVGCPELGERGSHLGIIPRRFRRCRRLFRPIYERQQREINRMRLQPFALTPKVIETECEDAAIAGTVWRALWQAQAGIYGFVDLDGRLRPWAKRFRAAARRGYARGRRFFLDDERLRGKLASEGRIERGKP